MTSRSPLLFPAGVLAGALAVLLLSPTAVSAAGTAKAAKPVQKTFASAQSAADALVAAAEKFDVEAMKKILGPDGIDLVVTDDEVQSRNQATAFAAKAREKLAVTPDPKDPKTATLVIGADEWPMPIPVVETGGRWRFDSKAGREEVLFRRIGRNELDAIEVCREYVAAQHAYAMERHDGSRVNQYAQRVVSTPGKRDGLAWQAPDGTWQGPLAERAAAAIAAGYTDRTEPYHGYYFKILKGQGPHAPLGEMDFVVQGAMIGGFALVASPATYEVTGVKSFIVSYEGVVYEKDLGPDTLEVFKAMERYDPDEGWHPVEER